MNLLVAWAFLIGAAFGLVLGYAAGVAEMILEQHKKRVRIVRALEKERKANQRLPDTLRRRLLGDEEMPRFMRCSPLPPPRRYVDTSGWRAFP